MNTKIVEVLYIHTFKYIKRNWYHYEQLMRFTKCDITQKLYSPWGCPFAYKSIMLRYSNKWYIRIMNEFWLMNSKNGLFSRISHRTTKMCDSCYIVWQGRVGWSDFLFWYYFFHFFTVDWYGKTYDICDLWTCEPVAPRSVFCKIILFFNLNSIAAIG